MTDTKLAAEMLRCFAELDRGYDRAEIEAQALALEQAAGDARRYRWLRDNCVTGLNGIEYYNMRGDHLTADAAIDAAIGAGE